MPTVDADRIQQVEDFSKEILRHVVETGQLPPALTEVPDPQAALDELESWWEANRGEVSDASVDFVFGLLASMVLPDSAESFKFVADYTAEELAAMAEGAADRAEELAAGVERRRALIESGKTLAHQAARQALGMALAAALAGL